MQGGVRQHIANQFESADANVNRNMESMSERLDTMTQLVLELTNEVKGLRAMVLESHASIQE